MCFCAEIVPIETRTRILVIRHALESGHSFNTGRLALLALSRASLHEFGAPGARFDESVVPAPSEAVLLFPGGAPGPPPRDPPPSTLVVLDGTWPQARHMRLRILPVRGLSTWSLPPPPRTLPRLRRSRVPGEISTFEAIAHALRLLEGEATAAALEGLYLRFLAAAVASGGRPCLDARRKAD